MLTALNPRVVIVGGGLSGLYAAALLEERGIRDYVLLEARDVFGGRIISVPHASSARRFDLGATWFWPNLQPGLLRIVRELGLETFEQYEAGSSLIERSRTQAPSKVDGAFSAPALRLTGGLAALIDAIRERLTASRLVSGCRVRRLRCVDDGIEVQADDRRGQAIAYRAAHVLLAVPPRLATHSLDFIPTLPQALMYQWRSCGTWMAPHAKYVAVFDEPFWRMQGLSGAAWSSVGPMAEIHDASPHDAALCGGGALFGFLGIHAQVRSRVPEADLLAHCRAQLVRLFGRPAEAPTAEFFKDWASDPYTAVVADQDPGGHHTMRLANTATDGVWSNRLVGIGSEWSLEFAGYVAGAVDAAQRGVDMLLAPSTAHSLLH